MMGEYYAKKKSNNETYRNILFMEVRRVTVEATRHVKKRKKNFIQLKTKLTPLKYDVSLCNFKMFRAGAVD